MVAGGDEGGKGVTKLSATKARMMWTDDMARTRGWTQRRGWGKILHINVKARAEMKLVVPSLPYPLYCNAHHNTDS